MDLIFSNTILISTIVVCFVYSFVFSIGALKLSYKYNRRNDSPGILWSILAFFFSGFYYPFYALVLDRD
jgi:hypothetical protein